MKRRSFLKAGAIGATATATATASFPTPAISQGRLRWKMITTWPKNFPGLGMAANRIGKQITEMSDGRLEVKVFGAGEIVPAFELFDAVRTGIAEMGHGWDGYWIAKHPGAPFFGGVPNGLGPIEQIAWIEHGGGQALWDDMHGAYGLKPFVAGTNPPSMFGWYTRPVESLADLDGLKVRMAGLPGEVMNRLGATAVNISGGEIMSSLQAGVVDAVEWGGPWMDLAFGFQKICNLCYWPGLHEPGPNQSLLVNKEIYDDLPKDLQRIIEVAASNAVAYLYGEGTLQNAVSYEVLKNEHNVQFNKLPDDVIQAFLEASNDVVRETGDRDPLAKKIYESFETFRKRAIDIAPVAELAYLSARTI